jgi:hypothetical protein
MAQEALDSLNGAIDTLEQEITYRPMKILGVAMNPNIVNSVLVGLLTLFVGMLKKVLL